MAANRSDLLKRARACSRVLEAFADMYQTLPPEVDDIIGRTIDQHLCLIGQEANRLYNLVKEDKL